MDELQHDLNTKQYSAAVKLAGKLLATKGPAAASLDRFNILMLKGEAQVGMRSLSAAASTFRLAEKETKDPRQVALAKWTAELFARAKGATYVPKTIGPGLQKQGPIDLMDNDKRKDAFAAMLDDELTTMEPKLKSATISQSLVQIWPVLEQVESLDQLDFLANGNDDKTTNVANALLDHSRNLLTNALKGMWDRVSDIDTHANVVTNTTTTAIINNQYVNQNVAKKNGLTPSNTTELQNIITQAQKIHDAADSFMTMAKNDKDWGTIVNDADRVAGRASDVLNADYGTPVSQTDTGLNTGYSTGLGNSLYPSGTTPIKPTAPANSSSKSKTSGNKNN
jgi:hypothetical protein